MTSSDAGPHPPDPRLSPALPEDARWMREAIALAKRAYGRTSPNPLVGCVIVRDGAVLGRGFHRRAGTAHAEVDALKDAAQRGHDVEGATLYVNLEPCSITNRTPPCADACVRAKLGRVVAGMVDPYPGVQGEGLRRLLDAGIAVTCGVLAGACAQVNAPFVTRVRLGRPHVTVKVAMSLDGKIATRTGDSFPMTGEAARERVHVLRDRVDAILVGRGTVVVDDPRLTCRLPDDKAALGGPRDPLRVVLDTELRISPNAKLLGLKADGVSSASTLIVAAEDGPPTPDALKRDGVEIVRVPRDASGHVSVPATLSALAARGVQSVLVEGGGEVIASFVGASMVDVWVAHIAPVLVGGREAKTPLAGLGAATLRGALRTRPMAASALGADVELVVPVMGDVYGLD